MQNAAGDVFFQATLDDSGRCAVAEARCRSAWAEMPAVRDRCIANFEGGAGFTGGVELAS